MKRALIGFLFCVAAFAGFAPLQAQDQFALVVGVSGYGGDREALEAQGFVVPGALSNARRDASIVGDGLAAAGFEVQRLEDPNKRQLLAAIGQFADRLRTGGEDAVGVFYFAGHGAQGRPPLERDIENYLVPIGAVMRTETDLESEAVGLSRISATLSGAGAGAIVIIIDACRDFAMPQANRTSSNTRGLAEARALPGTLVAYSTAPGGVANDGPAGGNGPYASALSRELFAARGSRIEDIFYVVRQDVLAATEDEQQPWENSSLVRPISVGVALDAGARSDGSQDLASTAPSAGSVSVDQIVFAELAAPCEYAMFARDYPDSALRGLAATRSAGSSPCDESGAASDGPSPAELVTRAQTLLAAMDCGDIAATGIVNAATRAAAGRFREAASLSGETVDQAFIDALSDANVAGFVCPNALPDVYEPVVQDLAALSADKGFEEPYYGWIELSAGFVPDPYEVNGIQAGGRDNAAFRHPACVGFVGQPPDFNLTYNAGFLPLLISASSEADVTLVINTPSGDWVCDDDSALGQNGLNPGITFDEPQSGLYNIWVGRVGVEGEFADATLFISELSYSELEVNFVEPLAEPAFGSVALSAGFAEDPYSVFIPEAGGPNDAYTLAPHCTGRIGNGPDYVVDYTAGDFPLYFSVSSDADARLVILTPDGEWACRDLNSLSGFDPGLVFERPESGQYRIWVGLAGDALAPTVTATLHVSEIDFFDEQITRGRSDVMIDPSAPPIYGAVSLDSGFVPDPYTVDVVPGGEFDASALAPGCVGFVAVAPDFDLYYNPGIYPLYIYTVGEIDATLVVRTPSGEWLCDDDSALGWNPGLWVKSPEAGLYDIWVGVYASDSAVASEAVELSISELPFDVD